VSFRQRSSTRSFGKVDAPLPIPSYRCFTAISPKCCGPFLLWAVALLFAEIDRPMRKAPERFDLCEIWNDTYGV
jgi:hypothetical protein